MVPTGAFHILYYFVVMSEVEMLEEEIEMLKAELECLKANIDAVVANLVRTECEQRDEAEDNDDAYLKTMTILSYIIKHQWFESQYILDLK